VNERQTRGEVWKRNGSTRNIEVVCYQPKGGGNLLASLEKKEGDEILEKNENVRTTNQCGGGIFSNTWRERKFNRRRGVSQPLYEKSAKKWEKVLRYFQRGKSSFSSTSISNPFLRCEGEWVNVERGGPN